MSGCRFAWVTRRVARASGSLAAAMVLGVMGWGYGDGVPAMYGAAAGCLGGNGGGVGAVLGLDYNFVVFEVSDDGR